MELTYEQVEEIVNNCWVHHETGACGDCPYYTDDYEDNNCAKINDIYARHGKHLRKSDGWGPMIREIGDEAFLEEMEAILKDPMQKLIEQVQAAEGSK